ncbi:MAG: sulfur reduction protein DsrJ [Sedimenticola sp.]|uniref:Sulfur reduction protein DsrJ n=1 Tax=Sedimenticola thiotaurini TaxID=1543721 RepID=A0A558CYA4_9GAMM|nr:sulfur reduction protein DsrJ [Sedimenticola sp.]MCW8882849.1 sulfur reduction protein DsrJ [Sedimenticola sp.]MCW8947951.1 sulfur reduction protein DsrJ [Sedimenticola sp.]TVT53737.1 MAG: sulfur reduction protein DsrJ [Sedimenticola thiotaurini]
MNRLTGIRRFAGVLVGGALLLLSTGVISETAVTKGSKAAGLDSCVAPTAVMRRNHMDFLKHDRNMTVRKGIRDTQYSLAECVGCHAEKDNAGAYKPVNAEGQFCSSCHSYVAVNLSCFQCHRKTPEVKSGSGTAMKSDGPFQPESLGLLQSPDQPVLLNRDELARLHATVKGD